MLEGFQVRFLFGGWRYPRIVKNLPWTYKKLHYKGEPYQILRYILQHRKTDNKQYLFRKQQHMLCPTGRTKLSISIYTDTVLPLSVASLGPGKVNNYFG